jgi:hypothetical protein
VAVLILEGSLRKDPVREFALGWLAVLALVSLLVLIALADMYQVVKAEHGKRKELIGEFRDAMEETFRKAKPPEPKQKPPEG